VYRLKIHLYGSEKDPLPLESGRDYTFGRGEGCDVMLEDQPGISRSHFRIFEDNGQWVLQVTSKFGSVIQAGQQVNHLTLEHGTSFKLASYDFRFEEYVETQDEAPMAEHESSQEPQAAVGSSQSLPALSPTFNGMGFGGAAASSAMPSPSASAAAAALAPLAEPEEFEGNDEATKVAVAASIGIPHIRIVEPKGTEETHKLEGKKWILGRDEGCDVVLNDRKASRRQVEITSTPQGYFIRDLGSANGTMVNGTLLGPDELKPIKSGDVISISALTLHFEIRDPSFEKKVMVIPAEVLAQVPMVAPQPYEMINYPVPSGPGGAIRIEPMGALPGHAGEWDDGAAAAAAEAKKKKIRFYMVAAAVIVLLIAGLSSLDSGQKKPTAATEASAFSKLPPEQQKMVKETYILARNLQLQGKYALEAAQLEKIHAILPEGFEKSKEMAEECHQQALNEERVRENEEIQRRLEENKRIIETNLRECEGLSKRSMDVDEVRRCLGPSIELDPTHPRIQAMLSFVQAKVDARNRQLAEQKDYRDRVGKGRALFAQAEEYEAKADVFRAIEAYRKHIASPYPDPDGLKPKSEKKIAAITKGINSQVETALAAAERSYSSGNFREAIDNINKAKEYDPQSEKAAELNAKVRRDLTNKVREIYSEAVIDEGIGLIPQAKDKWKNILKIDHPEGEYYKRAKSKLRAYGEL
jgi:pSer/pThr/pTyr-binding forkhead associated (FHA) protein